MPTLEEVRERYKQIEKLLKDFYWREYANCDDVHIDTIEGYRRIGIAGMMYASNLDYKLNVYLNLVDMQVDYELSKDDGSIDVVDSWKFEEIGVLKKVMRKWTFDKIIGPYRTYLIQQTPETCDD